MTHSKHSGFTLVELAIVLMIIGLLIGGILKGQELIANARVAKLINQHKSYQAAAITFNDSYGALPGDITNPATRLSNCSTARCNVGGNGDGHVGTLNSIYYSDEQNNFWIHMAVANLVSGVDTTTSWTPSNYVIGAPTPKSPLGGNFALVYAYYAVDSFYPNGIPTGHYWQMWDTDASGNIAIPSIPLTYLRRIDEKLDDGKPWTGEVLLDNGSCGVGAGATDYGSSSNLCTIDIRVHI
jgi:prepilin-type N-terminal cleavage/methylation domain-containing protein